MKEIKQTTLTGSITDQLDENEYFREGACERDEGSKEMRVRGKGRRRKACSKLQRKGEKEEGMAGW